MIPKKGTPKNTLPTFPTREFRLIIDSKIIKSLINDKFFQIYNYIEILRNSDPSIKINLYLQKHFCSNDDLINAEEIGIEIIEIENIKFKDQINLNEKIKIELDKFGNENAYELLAISELWQADGIITEDEFLIKERYKINLYQIIKVIPVNELKDVIEVIAHGNSIYTLTGPIPIKLNFDTYYQSAHWKAFRYAKWYSNIIKIISNQELRDNLRTAFLNRYPYILYSRDMVRFFELQRDYYSRRGLYQSYGLSIGFYINTFYLLIWGMLEQLTIIAKYVTGIELHEKKCGIRKNKFWIEFEKREKGLSEFIKRDKIQDWIKIMADLRNNAAHKTIKIPAPIILDSDNEKSDEEILELIKNDHQEMYEFLPETIMKEFEPTMIATWKARNSEPIFRSGVYIQKSNGNHYLYDPVMSVDHELTMLNAIIDAFICKLFRSYY